MAQSNLPPSNPLKLNTSVARQQVHSRSPTTKPHSPTTKTIEEQFLTCPICFEMYSHPKCLPCLHTFCRHCLASYIQSKNEVEMKVRKGFPCPVCKQFHFLKTWENPLHRWVEEFQNNFMIQKMIDYVLSKSKPGTSDTSSASGIKPQVSRPTVNFVPQEAAQTYNPAVPQRLIPSAPTLPEYGPLSTQDINNPSLNQSFLSPIRRTFGAHGIDSSNNSPFGQSDNSSGHVATQWGAIRPSSSFRELSPFVDLWGGPLSARSSSSNDLSRGEAPVIYVDAYTMERVNVYPNYHGSGYSDVCCLPKAKTIVVTDYNKQTVVHFSGYFPSNRISSKVKVGGRPSSIALLNSSENCVVVNLQNKGQIFLISIPDLNILHVLRTQHNYQSVAVLAFDTLLTGSSDRPARIDQIKIKHSTSEVSSSQDCLFENSESSWTIAAPSHICVLSEDKFVVADTVKKSLIGFDIKTENGRLVGQKSFSLAPSRDRRLRCPGGMCLNTSPGSFYVVDYGGNAVYCIYPGDTIRCEKVLGEKDGINRPSSVCLGPGGILCVVDWEGSISLYKRRS
ncbi:uncharacterized protein [Haliotis cracherodii]|uniref:uncharacterized protein n=1 Tax=Haliotis cracherodii TaxID=6455 RepID=UPI0039E8F1F4